MRTTNEDWKYRIVNASPTRLVIVTYDIILDRIETADEALSDGDLEKFRADISNAKEFVVELAAAVDMNSPVAAALINIYFFVNKLLTKAYFSNEPKYLRDAGGIVEKLRNGLLKEVDDGTAVSSPAETSANYGKF